MIDIIQQMEPPLFLSKFHIESVIVTHLSGTHYPSFQFILSNRDLERLFVYIIQQMEPPSLLL